MQKIDFRIFVVFVLLISPSLGSSDGWGAVGELSYNLMKDENFETHNTELFRHRSGLHVRHDLDFRLVLQQRNKQCDKLFNFKLIENDKFRLYVDPKTSSSKRGTPFLSLREPKHSGGSVYIEHQ